MKKILIVEDVFLVSEDLKLLLTESNYEVTGIADSFEQLQSSISGRLPDLVLLDINLKGSKSGIEIAKILREKWKLPFIFLTGQSDIISYEAAKEQFPAQYILKPFVPQSVLIAIDLVFNNMGEHSLEMPRRTSPTRRVFNDPMNRKKKVVIEISNIYWIESRQRYLAFYTETAHYMELLSLNGALEALGIDFIRIHRNYGVNLKVIKSVHENEVVLINGHVLPISRNYRKAIETALNN